MDRRKLRRMTCPQCAPRDRTCCACDGTRIVSLPVAQRACAWIWDVAGCACDACRRLRRLRDELPGSGERPTQATRTAPGLDGPDLRTTGKVVA